MQYTPIIIMFALFFLNVPVAYALMASAFYYFLFVNVGIPFDMVIGRMIASTESYPLLAMPFFITAGSIMNYSGISSRLMNLADLLTGRMIGGMAQSNVVLSALMGGVSGSSNADCALQCKILAPEMIKRGYSPAYSAAITAASATISPIIPPGIGLILYGFMASVSVGKMFLAGYVPGLMMTAALMAAVYITAKKRGYLRTRDYRINIKDFLKALLNSVWALFMPLGIIMGLRAGMFTPTEAGAVACVYAMLIGLFIYRELTLRHLPTILLESLLSTCVIMLIIVAANAFGFYMTYERIPQLITARITAITDSPVMFLLLVNMLLVFVGMFIEGTASLIILTPLLVPIARAMGVDLIQLGIIMTINAAVGGCTPPFGTLIFLACAVLKVKYIDFVREVIPFVIALMIVLGLVALVPAFSSFLPNLLM